MCIVLLGVYGQLLLAQCEYTGLVVDVSATSTCSLAICSPDLPVLELSDNPYGLEAGELIHFSYETLPGNGCGLGVPASLSCIFSDYNTGNPTFCNALFTWAPANLPGPYTLQFSPFVPQPLGESYLWDFGDGVTSAEMAPEYSYADEGTYEVCLTIATSDGCTATYCDTVLVGDPPNLCEFGINVAVEGLDLTAEVYNTTDFGPYYPQEVMWYHSETNDILGTSPILEFTLPDSSYMDELCIIYQVIYPGGSICEGDWCGSIWEEMPCVDTTLIQPNIECPNVFLPVCGCDGVTYINACEAEYHHGLTAWTPGPCAGNFGECIAYFSYTYTSDSSLVLFNTSVGDYNNFQWVVNGVVQASSENPYLISIPDEGYHTVCIEIWDTFTGCASSYCQEIYMGNEGNMCDYTDCVWPGDANGDYVANVYDLLSIGLGYGTVGLPRPDAHLDWVGQPAPSWGFAALAGMDFKHMDCNGDGLVLYDDLDAIELNYDSGEPPMTDPLEGGVPVYFSFDQDTIYVDETTPEYIPVTGGLYVGQPGQPAIDLHGLGVSLIYPQQDLLLPYSTTGEYLDNSFFGVSNQSLWMIQDLYEEKRIDLAFTRKEGEVVSGYGAVAEVGFIIISDIIGGRTDEIIPFELAIGGIQMIGENGAPLPYDLPVLVDSLVIVNKLPLTLVKEENTGAQIRIFPNPARERVWVEWDGLSVESVVLRNAFGQEMRQFQVTNMDRQEWQLEGLADGIYTLQFHTPDGIISKKLIVQ